MKKSFILLMALCLTIFFSCSNDDDNGNGGKTSEKLVRSIEHRDGETGEIYYTTQFLYDGNNRLIEMSDKGSSINNTTTYSYSGSSISVNYSGNGETESMRISLDDGGYITAISGNFQSTSYGQQFTYTDGLLKSTSNTFGEIESTREYSWSNGNIATVHYTENNETVRLKYSGSVNKTNLDLGSLVSWEFTELIGETIMVPIKFEGIASNNLITGNDAVILNIKYDFDPDGYPTVIYVYDGQYLLETMKINY